MQIKDETQRNDQEINVNCIFQTFCFVLCVDCEHVVKISNGCICISTLYLFQYNLGFVCFIHEKYLYGEFSPFNHE